VHVGNQRMPYWVTPSDKGAGAGSGKFLKSVCLEMHSLQLFPQKESAGEINMHLN